MRYILIFLICTGCVLQKPSIKETFLGFHSDNPYFIIYVGNHQSSSLGPLLIGVKNKIYSGFPGVSYKIEECQYIAVSNNLKSIAKTNGNYPDARKFVTCNMNNGANEIYITKRSEFEIIFKPIILYKQNEDVFDGYLSDIRYELDY